MNNPSQKRISNLPAATLKDLIDRGIIRAVITQPIPTKKEDTPEFKKHIHLKGVRIHQSAACRKYSISSSTMSQWVTRGVLKIIDQEKNRNILDEADVAYMASVLKSHKKSRGKWLFDKNGMPYSPTTSRNR